MSNTQASTGFITEPNDERRQQVAAQLAEFIDPDKVRIDQESLQGHGCDWTKLYEVNPLAIVFPKSIEQVQQLVAFARAEKIALVPSGGRTGLSGGAVASQGEIVVSFDYMNQMSDFNPVDRTVVCQPGVITQQLQDFAQEQGLYYPVDFASAGSSQIAGNIATNAGGIKVIKYGMTRDWVAGMKVVTGSGELIDLNKNLLKNNTGYDLRHLFAGSEGTLGLIVEATMRLTQTPKDLSVLVLGVPEMSAIMEILRAFQNRMPLTAFEFFSESGCQLTTAHGLQRPFETETPFYVLIEYENQSEQDAETAMEVFESCMEQGWVVDGVISQSESQAENLWALRENLGECCAPFTPYKNDISVTTSQVPGFLEDIDSVVSKAYPDFTLVWWGHIGDGNLHLNILKPESMAKEEFFEQCQAVNKQVFEIVERYDGSISAEHGVGLVKRDYIHYTRSEADVALMQGIKNVFDPDNIMNPGKIFAS